MSSASCINTKKGETPRAVIYMSIEGEIAAAYIVAEEVIRIKIPDPTVSKVIVSLLSAYYVWHMEYPTCYANILKYVYRSRDFDTSLKNCSTVVSKFIREYNNILKTDGNESI